jgi:tetratricopeptide (TPR) repeat protein
MRLSMDVLYENGGATCHDDIQLGAGFARFDHAFALGEDSHSHVRAALSKVRSFINAKQWELPKQLQRALPPMEYGQILFIAQITCLYSTYLRGQAYLAAGQGKEAAAEFQKILDHSGMVWNCWTGALARLGVARANALQAKNATGADADAARVRALAEYKDFLTLWKDGDPDIPIYKQAKAEHARFQGVDVAFSPGTRRHTATMQ